MSKKVKIWQCSRCAFYKAFSDDDSVGQCHRYPPKVASKRKSGGHKNGGHKSGGRKVLADVFPRVSEDNFCGEYQNLDFYKTFLQS
ncbi:MAG: hypothetical protein DRP66_06655 [Planctomycetota bacterium]|nr:MAG: hypothetical protein DRP66_06655 [Planctomycetota bacterium]